MGTVRRSLRTVQAKDLEPVRAFTFSVDGLGLQAWWPDEVMFESEAEARRAWVASRRPVWAQTRRYTVPGMAEHCDGLTMTAAAFLRDRWQHVQFDLAGALAALAKDHRRLLAFERTRGAREISDYLAILRDDLGRIEEAARAFPEAEVGSRRHPGFMQTSATYGRGA